MSADLKLAATTPETPNDRQATAAQRLDELVDAVRYELAPLIRAAELLADHQRVHKALEGHADHHKRFGDELTSACQGWRNPTATLDGSELQDLLRTAHRMAQRMAEAAE